MKLICHKTGNPNGRPIIFLHGLFGSGDDFSFVAQKLSKNHFCHLWDLPGHGKSEEINFLSFDEFCKFFFNQLGFFSQKPDLVGYSLGGRIALNLITQYPDFFNRIVIVAANPGIKSEEERLMRLKSDCELLANINSKEAFFQNWYREPLFGNLAQNPMFNDLLKTRLNCDLEKINKCMPFLSVGSQMPLWEKLSKTKNKVFYFSGELDAKYNAFGRILKENPFIETVVLPDCGHNLIFESPDLFLNYLTHFFR